MALANHNPGTWQNPPECQFVESINELTFHHHHDSSDSSILALSGRRRFDWGIFGLDDLKVLKRLARGRGASYLRLLRSGIKETKLRSNRRKHYTRRCRKRAYRV
jgi:hypothetical protein